MPYFRSCGYFDVEKALSAEGEILCPHCGGSDIEE